MSFDRAIEFTRKQEGGWADDIHDRGGRTRFGISSKAHPTVDLETLTWEKAKAIYRRDYWEGAGCDRLPEPVDMVVFDAAVHSGRMRAGQWIQEAVGAKADGVVGDVTVRAVEAECESRGAEAVALRVLQRRRAFMVRGFKHGWFSSREPLRFLGGFWSRTLELAAEVGR